ncbi:MAG TPA: hypothetical protein VMF06_24225 [Candidatus Limnocylindria bacterium]|nr:hypothetical protein [Candidatus Limnocylindria bacterium]
MRLKYLEMIQAVITRMAGNQTTLRTWSVTLGTAVVGFAVNNSAHPKAALLAVLPAGVFWILDGYYPGLERAFRALYNQERQIADDKPDFAMAIKPLIVEKWIEACTRPAVWLVHLPVIAVALVVGGRHV